MDTIIKTGEKAPGLQLFDLQGRGASLEELAGQIVVLNFWSAECEWCKRVDQELTKYQETWKDQVVVWWIASNPNESRELIERIAAERKLGIVLIDSKQSVANLYGVETTPHFFILDGEQTLRYQGAWDDITFRRRVATRIYVPEVVEALIHAQIPAISVTPAYGCALIRYPG